MLVACLAACALATAAPPPNDDYPGMTIDFDAEVTGTNVDATAQAGDFGSDPVNSVWYQFTATENRWTTVDTCGSDLDTVLSVKPPGIVIYDLSLCDEDDTSESYTFYAMAGLTYHVMVDGDQADQGEFVVRVRPDTDGPLTTVAGPTLRDGYETDITFEVRAFEPGPFDGPSPTRFECALDGNAFASCPSIVTLRGLTIGPHVFRARAFDAAGNPDPEPAEYTWTILPRPQPTGPGPPPPVFMPPTPVDVGPKVSRVTLRVAPRRDRRAPYTFAVSGEIRAPRCDGRVTVTLTAGRRTVARRTATVAANCSYRATLKTRRRGRFRVAARYGGNPATLPRDATAVTIRAG
jgi:hypothetical protein